MINLIGQGKIQTEDEVHEKYRELLDKYKNDPKYKIIFERR